MLNLQKNILCSSLIPEFLLGAPGINASEQGARMAAMENAKMREMIETLTPVQ
jgi:F0F1-type ATP synthase gamma subunit